MSSNETTGDGPAIVCIIGKSDSGKTTLIEKLIPALIRRGIRVGTIKHDVHGFSMDRKGKDSYRHKKAGASTTIISSSRMIGMVRDVDREHTIKDLVELYFCGFDLILTEGYKRESWPKIEVHRRELERPLLSDPSNGLIAVVSDEALEVTVPLFDLNDADRIAAFLLKYFNLNPQHNALLSKIR